MVDDTFPEGGEGTSRSGKQPAPIELVRERVVKDGSLVLVDRSPDAFLLGGTAVPKLKRSASALALFESEAQIKPLRSGFLRVLFSSAAEPPTSILPHYGVASVQERLEEHKRLAAEEGGFVLFREVLAGGGLPTLAKNLSLAGYYFQEAFPALFRRLEDTFIGMFPSVEKVTVRSEAVSSTSVQFELTLNERGVEQAIPQAEMSAGMLRTLVHLLEVTLAPAGSVIVIDEFENSLGMNCMPALTSYLLTRADCQFLLTSHHPYVINNLPIETWKLVRRAGSVVRVLLRRAGERPGAHGCLSGLQHAGPFSPGLPPGDAPGSESEAPLLEGPSRQRAGSRLPGRSP